MQNPTPDPEPTKQPTWKIPVTLHDMKVRADHIGGEIKQADTNIAAAKARQLEVQNMQRIADAAVASAIEIAADRRAERDALAAAMYAHTKKLGETDVAD